MWHERAAFIQGQFTRHRSNCQMSFNNLTIVGDYQNGNLYALDLNVYDDSVAEQKWLRSWRALPQDANNLKRTVQHTLQLDIESGVGLNAFDANLTADYITTEDGKRLLASSDLLVTNIHPASAGFNPQVILRFSDDGGHTWSNEHWAGMGKLGLYSTRVFFRRLGMTLKLRDRVYEISGTDPVKIAIMAAELQMSGTRM
jgi:hypothetical protein